MLYKNWLREWLHDCVAPTYKQRTFSRYSEIVDVHILPALGDTDMDELTPPVLQRFVTGLVKGGDRQAGIRPSSGTVNSVITVLKGSLKAANLMGVAGDVGADKLIRPKHTEKQVECFSHTEQKQIEKAVDGSGKQKLSGIILCLYTGLRIGELLALEWSDIDFERGTLSVSKTCYDGKNSDGRFGRITYAPKTQSSVRIIPIPKQLLPRIKRLMSGRTSDYIVSDSRGKPISVRSYQRSFERLLKKLGIPHRGFHSLRHTFATRALECGMDVRTLSEILGHKNPTVTLMRYAHSMFEHKKEMMDRLGRLL